MYRLFIILFAIFLNAVSVFAQIPEYELILKNDVQTGPNEYEFDIIIRPKAPTSSFELATLQCVLEFNTEIGNSLAFSIIPASSQLVSSQQPTAVERVGNLLQIFSRTPPGSGNGTIVNNELKVARFKLQDSIIFTTQSANIFWKNQVNPFTKVNAYVSGQNVSITDSLDHLNQMSNLPLPVELAFFSSSISDNTVTLKWQTKSELNNHGFEIERSSNANGFGSKIWSQIGFVRGSGVSNSQLDYSFSDRPTGGSIFYYRLKQIDFDGGFKYSDEIETTLVPSQVTLYQNYPNPFNPSTKIKFTIPAAAKVKLDLFNILGERVIALLDEYMDTGVYEVQFDGSRLVSGIYIYKLTANEVTQIKRMNLVK